MAKKSISNLTAGDKVRLKFHGSAQFGNDPYEETDVFVGFRTEDGQEQAIFQMFDAYKADNRWRYGTSGEVVTVLESL